MMHPVNDDVRAYVAAIPDGIRALFEHVHGLITSEHPGAEMVLSYKMPTYVVGTHRLHVAAWRHGLSLYGWQDDDGFVERHPELYNGKGTLKLPVGHQIPDDEIRALVRSSLS